MFPHFAARSPFLPERCSLLSPRGIFMSRRQSIRRFAFSTHGKSALSRIDAIEAHDYATPDTRTYSKNEARVLQIGCPLSGVKRTSPEKGVMSAFDPKRTSACTSSFLPRLA